VPLFQPFVHALQDIAGASYRIFWPLDLHLVAARGNIDAKPVFDLDKVGVELAEQCAEHAWFVEFDFGAGAALLVTPGGRW